MGLRVIKRFRRWFGLLQEDVRDKRVAVLTRERQVIKRDPRPDWLHSSGLFNGENVDPI